MLAALLAESRIPFEILFFLVAGAITLISKIAEKAKKARRLAIEEENKLSGRERMVLPGMEPDVRQPPPPAPSLTKVTRRKTISSPTVTSPAPHTRGTVSKRQQRKQRAATPVPVKADIHYERQNVAAHRTIQRLRANRNALRDAIVLREIFGPPVALRGLHKPGPGSAYFAGR